MSNSLVNYDGSITINPLAIAQPRTVEEIQATLRDRLRFPSPVRAMGSNHSLTPCAATEGTVIDMRHMTRVLDVDKVNHTFTAEAGLQMVDASIALREHGLQLMTNVEIGNMRLGSAACCHSKDALDGIEFGQASSYVTKIKWVTPAGDLAEASVEKNPDVLRMLRSSHGLAGVIHEVTLRVKPLEALHFTYLPREVKDLTQEEVDRMLGAEGLICWTIGRTSIFQRRQRVHDQGLFESIEAAGRRWLWNTGDAHFAHLIDQFVTNKDLHSAAQQSFMEIEKMLFGTLRLFGGITLLAPDKIIDYSKTERQNRYAFTFWAFPTDRWLATLREYLDFADKHFEETGFRCNMPLGAYHIRKDQSGILSYTYDGDIFSIDPIHSSTDDVAWHNFLREFNEFATQRGGIPLLNQSPFVTRSHMEAAYHQRWFEFSEWVRSMDPDGRMLNQFFSDLLSPKLTP